MLLARSEQRPGGPTFRPRLFLRLVDAEAWPSLLPAALGPADMQGLEIVLGTTDAHHVRNVLRMRTGDPCEVVLEPFGTVHLAEIVAYGREMRARLGPVAEEPRPAGLEVWLVQSVHEPVKLDLVVEKGTEVGIDGFVITAASGDAQAAWDRVERRIQRLERIALEAAKQSKRANVPCIKTAVSLDDCYVAAGAQGVCHLALEPAAPERFRAVLPATKDQVRGGRLVLWVGPEGGWSESQLDFFAIHGIVCGRLGDTVLRTETAGTVAAALARFAIEDR